MRTMTKQERVRAAIAGDTVDRPPVALWRHFPGDDQRPDDLARATVAWQRAYDFDLVKVSPSSSFCLRGWGARDEWLGTLEGTRDYTHHPVQTPEDWFNLRVLDPGEGELSAQIDCLRQIRAGVDAEVPVIRHDLQPTCPGKKPGWAGSPSRASAVLPRSLPCWPCCNH